MGEGSAPMRNEVLRHVRSWKITQLDRSGDAIHPTSEMRSPVLDQSTEAGCLEFFCSNQNESDRRDSNGGSPRAIASNAAHRTR